MDISKYALFADIAETKNFTKSGERMGYTQSGVSHVLKAMENELGFPLFLRDRRGVSLTSDAQALLPLVRNLLSVNEHLEQTAAALNGLEIGHLTIASFASISCNWLPSVIRTFRKECPGIEIELLEGSTDEILDWLHNSRADFGLLSRRNIGTLEWLPLYEDPLVAIFPRDFYLEGMTSFPIQAFTDMPFIISALDVDYDIHDAIQEARISPRIRVSSKDDHVISSMVASGLGVSILPRLTVESAGDSIQYLPLDPGFSRELGIGLRSQKALSPAARRFIALDQEMSPSF